MMRSISQSSFKVHRASDHISRCHFSRLEYAKEEARQITRYIRPSAPRRNHLMSEGWCSERDIIQFETAVKLNDTLDSALLEYKAFQILLCTAR